MKVFTFVPKNVVAKPGQFDHWAAFAETETEALLNIEIRYKVRGQDLDLVSVIEDRRKNSDRRLEDRRAG